MRIVASPVRFHPGLALFLWLWAIVVLQFLSVKALALLLTVLLVWGICRAATEMGRLLRRIRYFLMAIFITFAWFTPGEHCWVSVLGHYGPTAEGLTLAIFSGGRLVAIVCLTGLISAYLTPQQFMAGLYRLLLPLQYFHIPVAMIAVRAMLVLSYIESASYYRWRDWLMADAPATAIAEYEVTFDVPTIHLSHWMLTIVAVILLSILLLV